MRRRYGEGTELVWPENSAQVLYSPIQTRISTLNSQLILDKVLLVFGVNVFILGEAASRQAGEPKSRIVLLWLGTIVRKDVYGPSSSSHGSVPRAS